MPVDATPTNDRPSHHVSLEEVGGANKFGFILSDASGNLNPRAITRDPIQRTSLKTQQGSTRYSDFSEPFTPVDQDEWIGGRGNEDFERDQTRFFDVKRLNTWQTGRAILGPLETFVISGMRGGSQLMPGNVTFKAHTSTDRYIANKFTAGSNFSVSFVELLLRRVDYSSVTHTVGIYTDSSNQPGTLISGATGALSTSDLPAHSYDTALVRYILGTPPALTQGVSYWVVAFNSLGFPELAGNPATGNTRFSQDGSSWTAIATGYDMYFRALAADEARESLFFEYKQGLYVVTKPDNSTSGGRLYINGDRGTADSNAGQLDRLIDATKVWTTNQFTGAIVLLSGGTGSLEETPWRKILSNTGTQLLVDRNWLVTHDTTTEYVILGANNWTELAATGLTRPVTDVVVSKDVVYMAQGDATNIRRYNGQTVAGNWTDAFADDGTNRALFLEIGEDDIAGPQVWKANNNTVSVARANAQSWGTNLTFGSNISVGSSDERITGLDRYGAPESLWVLKEGSAWAILNDIPDQIPLREMFSVRSADNGRAHLVHGVYLYFSLLHSMQRYFQNNLDDKGPSRDAGMPSDRQAPIWAMEGYPGVFFAALNGRGTPYSAGSKRSSILLYNQFGWHELYRSGIRGKPIRNLFFQVLPGPTPDRLWFSEGMDTAFLNFPSDTLDPFRDADYRFTHEGHLITSWMYANLQDVQKLFYSLKVFAESVSGTAQFVHADYQLDGANEDSQWTTISGSFDTVPVKEIRLSANDDVKGRRIRFRLRFYTTDASKTPKVKAMVAEMLPRIATKYRYTLSFVTADDAEDLNGDRESYDKVTDLVTQLDTWANAPTVLVMRSNFKPYDNKRVLLDPSSLRPFALVPSSVEKQIGNIRVEEI